MSLMITPYNNNYRQQRPVFSGKTPILKNLGTNMAGAANDGSGFFAPLNKVYEKFTDLIAEHVTSKFVNLKPLNWLADKFKNTNNLFQHCLTVGSVITSGLYMQRTLVNKDLDKDRRNTLAVNQGLTFGLSTVGAYALDKYIRGWWDNVTARFAGHLLDDKDFYTNFKNQKDTIKAENKRLKAQKAELKSLPKLEKLIEEHLNYKILSDDNARSLMNKVKGMGLLRTMLVFGFVYRYFVPVVVTKPANKLCDMYLQKKKEKAENSQKA